MRLRGWPPAVAMVVVTALTLAGCGHSVVTPSGADRSAAPSSPLGDHVRFYVDPGGHAPRAVARLRASGRKHLARLLQRRIATRPTAHWLSDDPDAVLGDARSLTTAAAARRALPVLVAYNIPGRDCGSYSSGGAADAGAYLRWVGALAAGIGEHRAVVVLEPDAVAQALDGCERTGPPGRRYRMLHRAVAILKRKPAVRVYLDAGNASWIQDQEALASALERSGVDAADGFALNVSNFETSRTSTRYGARLSRRLSGEHFVIDTSRNGAGPPPRTTHPSAQPSWCNPVGRRVGVPPTTVTGSPLVDAYLWVKQPGDSDGACGRGAPPAGQWWLRYAAELAR